MHQWRKKNLDASSGMATDRWTHFEYDQKINPFCFEPILDAARLENFVFYYFSSGLRLGLNCLETSPSLVLCLYPPILGDCQLSTENCTTLSCHISDLAQKKNLLLYLPSEWLISLERFQDLNWLFLLKAEVILVYFQEASHELSHE